MLICTVSNNASLMHLAKGNAVTVTGTVRGVSLSGIQLQPYAVH